MSMGNFVLKGDNSCQGEIVIYQPDEETRFEVKRPAITKHIRNNFSSDELEESSVCSILERTASDGKTYMLNFII